MPEGLQTLEAVPATLPAQAHTQGTPAMLLSPCTWQAGAPRHARLGQAPARPCSRQPHTCQPMPPEPPPQAPPDDPQDCFPPQDPEQRSAAAALQQRQWELVEEQVAAAAEAACAPLAAADAVAAALQPWMAAAAGGEAAEWQACLAVESEFATAWATKALSGAPG